MATPRLQHNAALLSDGRVIVVGGVSSEEIFASTEIFDPEPVPVELMNFSIE